jgi:hypothetical protein
MSSKVTHRHHSRARTQVASAASGLITSAGLATGLLVLWVLLGAVV